MPAGLPQRDGAVRKPQDARTYGWSTRDMGNKFESTLLEPVSTEHRSAGDDRRDHTPAVPAPGPRARGDRDRIAGQDREVGGGDVDDSSCSRLVAAGPRRDLR